MIGYDKGVFLTYKIEAFIIHEHFNLNSHPPINKPYEFQPQQLCNHPIDLFISVLGQWSNENKANHLNETNNEVGDEKEKAQWDDDSCCYNRH